MFQIMLLNQVHVCKDSAHYYVHYFGGRIYPMAEPSAYSISSCSQTWEDNIKVYVKGTERDNVD
jgi:hypothetical protein